MKVTVFLGFTQPLLYLTLQKISIEIKNQISVTARFLNQKRFFRFSCLIKGNCLSIIQSSLMSVRLSVHPSLKILVTIESIGFYSSGNIPTGPVVVLGYFHPQPPKKQKKNPPHFFCRRYLWSLFFCRRFPWSFLFFL